MRLARIKYFLAAFLFLCTSFNLISQSDTIKKKNLSLDLGITRGHNINLWPFFKKYKNFEKKELQIIYPLFSKRTNYKAHTKHFQLLPFYISDSSSKGTTKRFLSLYYPSVLRTHKQKDSTGTYRSFNFLELAPHISLLGLNRSPNGLSVENNIFFFIWYRKDILQEKTRLVVFPTYWYFANKRDTTNLFFPFYLQRKTENSKYLNVAFLYNQKYTLTEKKNSLFPIWWHKVNYVGNDTIKKDLVLPFYWSKKSKYEKRTLLFPLIYNVKTQQRQSFTFFPLFSYGHRYDSSSKYFAVTPLFWHAKNRNGIRNVMFPVYWNFKDYYRNDTVERQVIFPFVWTHRSKNAINTTIFPFYYNYQNKYRSSVTVLPFFSTYEEFKTGYGYKYIFPFYWKTRNRYQSKTTLFPLYWSKTDYRGRDTTFSNYIFPLFFSGRTRTKNYQVFFPIIYRFRSPEYHSFTFFPLFASGRSTDSTRSLLSVTPFFWRVKTQTGLTKVLFLYWNNEHYKGNDTTYHHGIFPFYWSGKNKTKQNTIIFPFVFKINNKKRESLTVFPLFSYGHKKDSTKNYIGITPLFYRIKGKHSLTHVLFPIYWNSKFYRTYDTVRTEIIFPFVWLNSRKDRSTKVVFPFMFAHQDKYKESMSVFPLFSYGRHYDSTKSHLMVTPFYWHFEKRNSISNVVFPLYWQKTNYYNNDTSKSLVLFPIFWHQKSKERSRTFLYPIIYNIKTKERQSFTFLPLFSFGKTINSTKHLVITPIFLHFKNKRNVKTTLFPIYWSRKYFSNYDTLKRTVLFPLYWSFQNKYKKTDVFFPLVWRYKKTYYTSFTLFPLFSIGHGNNGKKHLMITPLFGKFNSDKGTNAFLFPVFNYRRSGDEKHYAAFLFLFMRTTKPDYAKTAILWPICEQLRDKDKRKFRIAPIVWFSKTDSSKMLSVQPLFYSNRTKQRNVFVLSAFLYKRERVFEKSVSNSFLLRLYYHKNYTNGDFERRFLHLVVANIKVDGHREKSFLPFFHTVKEENGDRSVSYFFGLYNRFKEYKPEIKDFYEEERLFWFIRLRSNYKQLKSEGKDAFVRKRNKKR